MGTRVRVICRRARAVCVQGNVDPAVLLGPSAGIEAAVGQCIERAGGPGTHILNLGHGVVPATPEEAVATFVEAAKAIRRAD